MNSKLSKKIRKAARAEMAGEPVRDIVAAPKCDTTAFNNPLTQRGMIRAMKKAALATTKGR